MRLVHMQKTLRAVQRYAGRTLEVRRAINRANVGELARFGFVQAEANASSAMRIVGLTEQGRRFLQTFRRGYRFCDGF